MRDHSAAAPPVAITTARAAITRPSSQIRPRQRLVGAIHSACARAPSKTVDARLFGGERGELAHDAPAGGAAAGVHDPPDRMSALEAEREVPEAIGVEAHAERLQIADALGRLVHERFGGAAAHERAPGELGVAQVQLEAVVGGERGGEPALRPVAGGLCERRGGDEHDAGALTRGAQRGIQAGGARAHHCDIGLVGPCRGKDGHRGNRICPRCAAPSRVGAGVFRVRLSRRGRSIACVSTGFGAGQHFALAQQFFDSFAEAKAAFRFAFGFRRFGMARSGASGARRGGGCRSDRRGCGRGGC